MPQRRASEWGESCLFSERIYMPNCFHANKQTGVQKLERYFQSFSYTLLSDHQMHGH
jgi:hypothetical protein